MSRVDKQLVTYQMNWSRPAAVVVVLYHLWFLDVLPYTV